MTSETQKAVERQHLLAFVEDLAPLLAQGNTDAKTRLAEIAPLLHGRQRELFAILNSQVSEYDFADALRTLERLRKEL